MTDNRTYRVISKNDKRLKLFIGESAKEEFKEIMNWTEKEFKLHTILIK